MSTAELKAKLMELIDGMDDDQILGEVYQLLSQRENDPAKDWWDDLTEKHLARLEQSISDFNDGKIVSHAEVKKNTQQWLSE